MFFKREIIVARKGLVESNERKKRQVKAWSARRQQLKSVIMNKDLPLEERFEASLKLSQMPRNSAAVRVRARCFATGRPRGVYRDFGLSRVILRDMMRKGLLPGYTYSSW